MPVVDAISKDYADSVVFVAVAWKGTFEATSARAAELLPSGVIRWGLDETGEVFALYGVAYQPATALIDADKRVVDSWTSLPEEAEIRAALDALVAGS